MILCAVIIAYLKWNNETLKFGMFTVMAALETSSFVKRCDYCQKIYSKETLRSHIRNMHVNALLKCSECKAGFKTEDHLWRHIKLMHSKDKHEEHNQQSTCSNFEEKSSESIHPPVSVVNAPASASTQQQDDVVMKEEAADEELELGPVVFQHMDCNYRPYKEKPLFD